MITDYCFASTVALFFITCIWPSKDMIDVAWKIVIAVLTVMGVVATLISMGFHR